MQAPGVVSVKLPATNCDSMSRLHAWSGSLQSAAHCCLVIWGRIYRLAPLTNQNLLEDSC